MAEKIELLRGSGNVYRDLGEPDADLRQAKALLAAEIIGVLDDQGLSTRKAEAITGINQADFVRIRNADIKRFTLDRLMRILNRLGRHVEVEVTPARSNRLQPA